MRTKLLFFAGILVVASGFLSPGLALALGLVFGFTCIHPYQREAKRTSHILLQASVVALGFGMDLKQVIAVGRSGILYTAIGITLALAVGIALGRWLQVQKTSSFLISVGTAICGGSAIAAVGPIACATEEQMAVSLGAIFVLNSVALLVFPPIGWTLHLSQLQFGLWSALAIQDTSSVVGATARYGALALSVGTTVKLARALWIIPVSLGTAVLTHSKQRVRLPWFIGLFILAAFAHTVLPAWRSSFTALDHLGKTGLAITLFLIGASLSPYTLKKVGSRPLLQAFILWLAVAGVSLWLIASGRIGL